MSRGHGPFWAVVLTLFALALPGAAQAATWQLMPDPAPGGVEDIFQEGAPRVSLAVVGGRPYLATVSGRGSDQLTVHRLSADRSRWVQVGGVVSNGPVVGVPEMASSSRTPWVAWRERTDSGTFRVHVARLRDGRFRQIYGGLRRTETGVETGTLDLAVFGGVPYVAYQDASERVRVVRLDGDDHQFRAASSGLPDGIAWPSTAHFATAGGRLYLAFSIGVDEPATTVVARLATSRRSWTVLARDHNADADFAPVRDAVGGGGTVYVALGAVVKRLTAAGRLVEVGDPSTRAESLGYANGVLHAFYETQPAPDINIPHLVALVGGDWQAETPPPWQGDRPPPTIDGDVGRTQFVKSGKDLWLVWDWAEGDFASPRNVHVARLR